MAVDFKNIPDDVIFIGICQAQGLPIGSNFYKKTIEKYPEYFPKEHKRMERWKAIPQEVHDAFSKESGDLYSAFFNQLPEYGGLMEAVNNTENYQKYSLAYDRLYPEFEMKQEELHKKHYSKYKV